jgi:hypothetical protein
MFSSRPNVAESLLDFEAYDFAVPAFAPQFGHTSEMAKSIFAPQFPQKSSIYKKREFLIKKSCDFILIIV